MVKVRMIRISIGTVAETDDDSSSGKTDFEPDGIKVRRFEIYEPLYVCVCVCVYIYIYIYIHIYSIYIYTYIYILD